MHRCGPIAERIGWGLLGASWIADVAMADAIASSSNGRLVAVAARERWRAERFAAAHGVPRVHDSYEAVIEDPEVDAVYNPLVNSLHHPWTMRALAAGRHVLCEKPLALDAEKAEAMTAAARSADRLLMEAFMYRFHPRMREIVAGLRQPQLVQAGFGFPLTRPGDHRLDPALGGGALLDVGCYSISVARWILGEPEVVAATGSGEPVDRTVAISLGFPGGAQASLWASFDTAEREELTVVSTDRVTVVPRPFTAHRDPDDPYRVMVEEFGAAVLSGSPAPLAPADSVANMRVIDRVRQALAVTRGRPSRRRGDGPAPAPGAR